jgi:hypothetical protein
LIAAGDITITGIPLKNTILYQIAINNGTGGFYKFTLIYDSIEDTWRIE